LHKLDRHWAQQEGIRKVESKIIKALKHPDYWVRHSASKLLELLKVDPDRLSSAPAAAPEKMTREAPPHPAASALADLLFDRDRDLRLAAAAALGRLRDKSAGSVLTAALRDTDSSVRQAAQAALAALN
ncbi:MAG TPA: HEAT repeat domain-containing protein, partial [Verrucomicrobiae bacterium]